MPTYLFEGTLVLGKGVSPRVEFTTTTKISPGAYCPEKMRPLKKIRTSRSMSGNREYVPKRLHSPLRNSLNFPLSREDKQLPCSRCSSDCVCAMRRTKSYSSLHDIDLKAAQERSERYWHLYRFWQREVDNLRRSRG
ncbi:hypothetical protein TcWFU_004841 [Taenia crassiceps]|uniref:Uncharacterized protein n=1 Tax=Taenia crassiceps TaxID=6207 RepID=A0ABR4PZ13_9CEST